MPVTAPPATPPPKHLVRNVDADNLLERFLVAAVTAFLGIRLYLALTGYPQVGGGTLHIAHMLWGGVLMLVALVMTLTFLGGHVRHRAAIIGGLGFGTFIDELGKFITKDNDYFFRPTIALIYAVFVLLFLVFQALARARPASPRAALVMAIDAATEALLRGFTAEDRSRALRLLNASDPADPLVRALRHELDRVHPEPPTDISFTARLTGALRRFYDRVIRAPWFLKFVIALFILNAVVTLFGLGVEIVDDPSFSNRDLHFSFVDGLKTLASATSDGMILAGLVALRRSRLTAYRWFKRSILVSIFLVQFFWFYADELAAAGWLALSLVLLATLNYAIRRELVEEAGPLVATSATSIA